MRERERETASSRERDERDESATRKDEKEIIFVFCPIFFCYSTTPFVKHFFFIEFPLSKSYNLQYD